MFLVVLEGMVYTVGAIFAAAALYLGTYVRTYRKVISSSTLYHRRFVFEAFYAQVLYLFLFIFSDFFFNLF